MYACFYSHPALSFLFINFPSPSLSFSLENMGQKARRAVSSILIFIFILVSTSFHLYRYEISGNDLQPLPLNFTPTPTTTTTINSFNNNPYHVNYALQEADGNYSPTRHVSSVQDFTVTIAILMPAWEVLVVVLSPESFLTADSGEEYSCLFQNNATSPAKFSGILSFSNLITFKCVLPTSVRRLRPFFMPVLIKSPEKLPEKVSPDRELVRWSFLAYESFSTETDVVLFAKGVNSRQGTNLPPASLRCVFGDSVKTAVISSSQEVFRCLHPNVTAVNSGGYERIKISLEIKEENRVVPLPSVAYYTATRNIAIQEPKSLVCACTMVYNVAKFLKEWVVYHSHIGVEKFILYDNDSDDELGEVVEELVRDGYDIRTLFWLWPKTQEAGFSHCALFAQESCSWMMYVDVDEFVLSPSWLNSSQPFKNMLKSLLPKTRLESPSLSLSSPSLRLVRPVGQVSIRCIEFGPSNQRSHPVNGVTQGYTCRRRVEQRHKSLVLLDAIHPSLLNVIHHFQIKEDYRMKRLCMENAVVNHYKYQAWSEFKAKFRRRVSAYVIDWTQAVNPTSKDRTPGLGFEPIEPKEWAEMFCEVQDDRLRLLTQRWFGSNHSSNDYKMAWQR